MCWKVFHNKTLKKGSNELQNMTTCSTLKIWRPVEKTPHENTTNSIASIKPWTESNLETKYSHYIKLPLPSLNQCSAFTNFLHGSSDTLMLISGCLFKCIFLCMIAWKNKPASWTKCFLIAANLGNCLVISRYFYFLSIFQLHQLFSMLEYSCVIIHKIKT